MADNKPRSSPSDAAPPRRLLDQAPVAPGTQAPDAQPQHEGGMQLPHERDQSVRGDSTGSHGTGAAGERQREVMGQAGDDLKQGQVDTDLRTTPGLDAERRDRLVPGPAPSGPTRRGGG